jgi:hypothetical protein
MYVRGGAIHSLEKHDLDILCSACPRPWLAKKPNRTARPQKNGSAAAWSASLNPRGGLQGIARQVKKRDSYKTLHWRPPGYAPLQTVTKKAVRSTYN